MITPLLIFLALSVALLFSRTPITIIKPVNIALGGLMFLVFYAIFSPKRLVSVAANIMLQQVLIKYFGVSDCFDTRLKIAFGFVVTNVAIHLFLKYFFSINNFF